MRYMQEGWPGKGKRENEDVEKSENWRTHSLSVMGVYYTVSE